jgi:hypothetical protein
MVGELAAFRAVVSSTAKSVLSCLPSDTTCAEVVGKLVAKFKKLEGQRSQLERPAARIYDPLLGPPPGRVWLADHLDEATGQFRAKLATR